MSIFNSILNKLNLGKPAPVGPVAAEAPIPPKPQQPIPRPAPQGPIMAEAPIPPKVVPPAPQPAPQPAPPPPPKAIPEVDVVAKLNELAKANPQKLNWKVSIVDLLKLLSLDSSFAARKELAAELHCPAEKMADSAQMNMWLHKTVLQKLAENGGNIPKELL